MSKDFKKELLKSKKAKVPKKLIALRLPEDLYLEVQKLSKETGLNVTEIITTALRSKLNLPVK
jgi:hypothetical protein